MLFHLFSVKVFRAQGVGKFPSFFRWNLHKLRYLGMYFELPNGYNVLG